MVGYFYYFTMFIFKRMGVIIIGVSERNVLNKHEYSSLVELDSISSNYFAIPADVILGTDINEKRITVFSFFSIRRGLDCNLLFSVNNIVKWMGKQPNRNANGINNKIIQTIESLSDRGYLTLSEKLTNSSCMEATFNLSKISQECEQERFAIVYLDELQKILNYQFSNSKDAYLNNDVVLLVFAYLRMKIYRRRNKLFPEEINIDDQNNIQYDILKRKENSPDAYNCFYSDIAKDLNISDRIVSKVVAILNEIGLIYSETLPRIKYNDGKSEKWRTDHTVFCNTYKREGNCLLVSGSEYYLSEVENKKKKLNIINKI